MTDEAEKKYNKRGACFSCSKCKYVGDKQQTTRHWVTKHLLRDEAPYSCNHCSRITFKDTEMKKHFHEKHAGLEMVTGVSGSKLPYTLKPTDATELSKEESLKEYSGKYSKPGSVKEGSKVNRSQSSPMEELRSLLEKHPSLMEEWQDLGQPHQEAGNTPELPNIPATPTSKTSSDNPSEIHSPSSTIFSTPTSSAPTPRNMKKKINLPVPNISQVKPSLWPISLINSATPSVQFSSVPEMDTHPPETEVSEFSSTNLIPPPLKHSPQTMKDTQFLNNSTLPPQQSVSVPELDIHVCKTEEAEFLTTNVLPSPLKPSAQSKKLTKDCETRKTNKEEMGVNGKREEMPTKGTQKSRKEVKNETCGERDIKRDRTKAMASKAETNKDTISKNDTDDKREHKERVTKKDRAPKRSFDKDKTDSPTPSKIQKTGSTGNQESSDKPNQNGDSETIKRPGTTSNDSYVAFQTLVPLSAVGDIVENAIKNSVDSVASAVKVATKSQPMTPEQDLRPVSNQLTTTNTKLAQILDIMSAKNSKNNKLLAELDEFIKITSDLSAQLPGLTRAITVITEVANKMDQHIVEHTNAIRSVVQLTSDAHTGLTTAMNVHIETLKTIQNQLIPNIDNEMPISETTKPPPPQTKQKEMTKAKSSRPRGNTPRPDSQEKQRQTDNRRSWTHRSQTPQNRRPFYKTPWEKQYQRYKQRLSGGTGRKSPEKDERHRSGSRGY